MNDVAGWCEMFWYKLKVKDVTKQTELSVIHFTFNNCINAHKHRRFVN